MEEDEEWEDWRGRNNVRERARSVSSSPGRDISDFRAGDLDQRSADRDTSVKSSRDETAARNGSHRHQDRRERSSPIRDQRRSQGGRGRYRSPEDRRYPSSQNRRYRRDRHRSPEDRGRYRS